LIKYSRIAILIIVDAIAINLSFIGAFLLRFDSNINSTEFGLFFPVYGNNIIPITLICLAGFALMGIYTSMWRYAGTEETLKIAFSAVLSNVFVLGFITMLGQILPRSIYLICILLMAASVITTRLAYRFLRSLRNPGNHNASNKKAVRMDIFGRNYIKIMVIGAGDAGATMIKEIKHHPEHGKKVVVAVDDDRSKHGQRISGVKVAGGQEKIKYLVRKYGVEEIIIAIPTAKQKEIKKIVAECNKTRCKLKILPSLIDIISEKVTVSKLRNVEIEDLLGREPVNLNVREISGYLEGKIVLVTGGGGSIGSELCRQIARFRPRRIISFDIYENTVFELTNEMKKMFPAIEFEAVIGSVRDKARLNRVMECYKPHVVFHAAAHKHVPLMEGNSCEALINNVIGTKNMVDISEKYAVQKFVMISTDKAVNPTNVMGASKRIAEMIIQEKSKTSATTFVAVRFGNVLGSNGSVIPIFRKQIENGGPVTLTHKDITRYFMTIPEAVQLVIQTGAIAKSGEIYVLDMGEPVKILDLAETVIKLSGFVPYEDIDIEVVGLRPGEKLYEELLLAEEGIENTNHEKIYVGHPLEAVKELKVLLESDKLEEKILEICELPEEEIRSWMRQMVPNYNNHNNM
jgi:FlaA1/EpsC-like NDP-sugar epimerase